MQISERMTTHILLDFCHAHFYTNDYSYYFWMGFVMHIFVRMTIHIILVWVFVMHISVQMTTHILMGFRHAHLCTNDYPYYSCMGFCHAQLCTNNYSYYSCMGFRHAPIYTNDYPYSYGFSSCTSLYEWLFCSQFLSNAFLLNRNSEFLGAFSSNVSVSPCAQCSLTR